MICKDHNYELITHYILLTLLDTVGDYIDEVSPIKIKSNNQRLHSVFKTGYKFLINLFI